MILKPAISKIKNFHVFLMELRYDVDKVMVTWLVFVSMMGLVD